MEATIREDNITDNPNMQNQTSTCTTTTQVNLTRPARLNEWLTEYQAEEDRAEARAEAGLARHQASAAGKAHTLAWARSIPITVAPVPANISKLASAHFNGRAGTQAVLAYIRHNLTNYEQLLTELNHRRGADQAYAVLRHRVDAQSQAALARARAH